MSTWTPEELAAVGDADELRIASVRKDGTLRPYVTIWVVRVDDELFVRSAHGPTNPWYVRAEASGTGRISAGGIERDVSFESASAAGRDAIDAAYHAKYDSYGQQYVGPVVGDEAAASTIKLSPR